MGSRRMALVLLSDADERLGEAGVFAASGAATGFAVRLLLTGPALARALEGRLPETLLARLAAARDAGDVRVYACSAAVRRLGVCEGALPPPLDEAAGVPAFLEHLAGADVQLLF